MVTRRQNVIVQQPQLQARHTTVSRIGPLGGPATTVGVRGDFADWQRNALDLTCFVDADCDDHNPCTNDLCDTGTGQCDHLNLADETPCGDGDSGWCDGSGSCFEPECGSGLPDCDDGNACTVDSCSEYECSFDAEAAAGFGCDDGDGCTIGDQCDGLGGCAGTLDDTIPGCSSCLPKGEVCTLDSECCSGSCHPIKLTCK